MAQSCAQAAAWVRDNYEKHPEGVVAKYIIHSNYGKYCETQQRPVMETSIFGRVVKQVFPDVIIRRLGGRYNLKYYYCGIQAQSTSPYVSDNTNTTRPKRKQRKRDVATDSPEVQHCLRWLHTYYTQNVEGSISKCELYSHYTQDSSAWPAEPLSIQHFTSLVTNNFTRTSKKKYGSKSATSTQPSMFIGISPRTVPVDPGAMSTEICNIYEPIPAECTLGGYREGSNTPDDDDYSCRSPDSEEGFDMSPGNPDTTCAELRSEGLPENYAYCYDSIIKNEPDPEPEDYRIATLQLSESMVIKEEKSTEYPNMPLQMSDFSAHLMRATPESPHMTDSPTSSPSPPQGVTKKKPYKPKFHGKDWDNESAIKLEHDNQYCMEDSLQHNDESMLKRWLFECLVPCDTDAVNRDELHRHYENSCHAVNVSPLLLADFDRVVLKYYPGTRTTMISPGVTFYAGVSINSSSRLYSRVETHYISEIENPHTWDDSDRQNSFEMHSPPPQDTSSLENIEDEEEDIEDDVEDLHSFPEVLRDGKYYLRTWLIDNFEPVAESCVLKAGAYGHYESYAKSIGQTAFEMNVFGKIVRKVFPDVSIRRLGGRVKPQYYYCGIAAKQTSPLYPLLNAKDPAQRSRKKEIATDNHTAELVIEWLRRTYEPCQRGHILKSEVFTKYTIYCDSIGESPVSLNYFGKLVKHCFSEVEVRKFGGRSDPNWYYFGISAKESSSLTQHTMPMDDLNESRIQYVGSPNQSHHIPLQQSRSNPIAVPGSIPTSIDSPFSQSPHVILNHHLDSRFGQSPQLILSQGFLQQHSQSLRHQPHSQQSSPFSSSLEAQVHRSSLTPDHQQYSGGSPSLPRAFRDGIVPTSHNMLNAS